MSFFSATPIVSSLLAVSVALAALPAAADMTLDPAESSLSVISTKVMAPGNVSASERFTFSKLTGTIDADGNAAVKIPLATINTAIGIRDERMAEFFFEVDKYPEATVTASIPAELLKDGTQLSELAFTLSLHGKTTELTVPVLVSSMKGKVLVSATQPVMLDANQYDLGAGLNKLAELAKLAYIPTTVPVSFNLTFVSEDK